MNTENAKAVVLSSGGLDSTTCLGIAVDQFGADNVVTLSVFYGQRHDKEIECAAAVADYYGVKHYEVDLSATMQFSDCNLLKKNEDTIPNKSYAQQMKDNGSGRVSTYVPFRNGLMLSAAATVADSLFPNQRVYIFYGAHADDAAGEAYADCSPEFAEKMSEAIKVGTYGNITIAAPLIYKTKAEVVTEGLKLRVPYELTWSCYHGGNKQCGVCGTCIDRKAAFEANGVEDPQGYEEI